jgi:hypothetical protein
MGGSQSTELVDQIVSDALQGKITIYAGMSADQFKHAVTKWAKSAKIDSRRPVKSYNDGIDRLTKWVLRER